MPRITDQTAFRTIGRVSFERWNHDVLEAGGRAELASRGSWDAGGELSAVLQALCWQETKLDTVYEKSSKANNNPFNIRVPDYSNEDNPKGYVTYPTLAASVAAARGRINGESGYFDGPNPYATAASIRDLVSTYAPPGPSDKPWNPTERLIAEMVSYLNALLPDWEGPITPEPTTDLDRLVFGRGVKPAFMTMLLKKTYGDGVDYRAPMKKIGITAHETQLDVAGDGMAELKFWYDFFNCPNGERCENAATHFVVSTNGMGACLIDPMSSMEPWVNGGSPAPRGEWNDKFGSAMRNALLLGIENNKKKGGRLSAGQIAWNAQMLAQVLDDNKVPWYEMPFYKGVSQIQVHRLLAPTDCMIWDEDRAAIAAQAKEWGKRWQAAGIPDVPANPQPGGQPTDKPIEIFAGLDVEMAQRWFGKIVQDGRTYQLTWPLGPAATLWVEHGKQTGSFAPLQSVEPYLDGRLYLRFADGFTTWRPSANEPMRVLKG